MFRFAQFATGRVRCGGHDSRYHFASCHKFRGVVILLLSCVALIADAEAQAETLSKLADDFWSWRAKYAPFTGDDVNRIERPGGMRDWSRASIDQRRKDLAGFEARWKKLNPAQWPISKQVDYKLVGSALSRVRWELEVNPRWKRDPNFYIEQTLTALAEALTVPAPYDEARSRKFSPAWKTFRRSCGKLRKISRIRRRRLQLSRFRISMAFAITCAR